VTRRAGRLLLAALPLACTAPPAEEAPPPTVERAARPPFHFADVTAGAGLDVVQVGGDPAGDYIIDTIGCGAAWLDHDGDGDADLYLAQGASGPGEGPPDHLFRNDGDPDGDGVPEFTDVTTAAGLGDRTWSFGVAVADYDNDGDDDLYLLNWGPNRLYRNEGDGTFAEIGAAAGVDDDGWGVSAAWGDVDRDGDLDLYVANYVVFGYDRYPRRGQPGRSGEPPCRWRDIEVMCGPRNLEPGRNVFYRNVGDGDGDGIPRFVNATVEAGLDPGIPAYALDALFFDGNGDLAPDLYVANDSVGNFYFVNRGDGTFREIGVLAGLAYSEQGHEQASMGIATSDFDGNGHADLLVTNFSHDYDTLFRNDGNDLFTDVSYRAGLGAATYMPLAWGALFADLDHDGWEDLYIANGHVYPQVDGHDLGTTFRQRDGLFRNTGRGTFEEVTAAAGPGLAIVESSRAVLPADLDADGDLDLLVTHLNARPSLLRNDGAPGHWLQVALRGSRSTRDGIGALVRLEAGGRVMTREVTRSASFAASREPRVHFGLGATERIDRLEVRWPSGAVSSLEDLPVDRLLRVNEE
jgi:hypothetical protein